MIIGKKLKELRNNLGISQRELASRLTVSAGTVAIIGKVVELRAKF